MSTRTLLSALVATALALPALAQTPDTPPADQPAPAAATVQGAEPAAGSASRDKDTLSVDFPDEDIKTILRNVADLFELNLVVPDTLTGKTSIKLRDVTWEQIFTVVLAPVGYTYIKEGNIIKIVSNELLQQEPGTTEVFILNNAKADQIKPTIDGLIDAAAGGKIVIDGRSNALVITERPSRMGRIRSIIEQLDKATDQVMIESKFVEVTDRDVRNIGVNWASLQGMQFGVRGMNQTFNRSRTQATNDGATSSDGTNNGNAITYVSAPAIDGGGNFATSTINLPSGSVTGLPATIPGSTGLAGFTPATAGTPAIPGTPGIPAIPAIPGFVDNSSGTGILVPGVAGVPAVPGTPGTPAGAGTSATATALNTFTGSISSAASQLMGLTNTGGTSRVASAVFSSSDFNVIISALKTQNNTKIVSNPTVVTLNNSEAILNIGQEFPIPSYTYNSERGSFEVSGFTYKPIGIILKVTPQVNARGLIKLALEPEVSQQNGSTSFGGAGGASIPVIATRKVKTNISLQDGYTAGIGGLITVSQDHGGTKVPVLGSIPFLGRLFSSKNVNDVTTNLLIFITAKTVTADGASPEVVFDPRAVSAVGMSRDDLPGYRAPKGGDLYSTPAPVKK